MSFAAPIGRTIEFPLSTSNPPPLALGRPFSIAVAIRLTAAASVARSIGPADIPGWPVGGVEGEGTGADAVAAAPQEAAGAEDDAGNGASDADW